MVVSINETRSPMRSRKDATMTLPSTSTTPTLYRHPLSGHSHRAQLFLSILGVPCSLVDVDVLKAEHKAPDFLAKNAFGQLPVLQDGDDTIADSNAILVYLALKYDAERRWLPVDPLAQASVQRWLSVAAGQLAYGPAAARLITIFGAPFQPDEVKGRARALFGVMEGHLATRPFLVGDAATIADLALYAYVDRAPEGGIVLDDFPGVRAWLGRIEALPGFVPMARLAP